MPIPLRVLIVEDTPGDAELLILHLTAEGFQPDWTCVQTEADYLAALAALPDLILADWSLPQFSGLRALQLMRTRGLDIPFIIVSGSVGEEAAIDALRQGAYDYVLKDRPARLGPAARHALAEKRLREERQQVAEALRQSEEQYRSVAQMAPDALMTVDAAGRIVTWNYGAQRIFQYTEAEALGQALTALLPETFRALHEAGMARLGAGGEPRVLGHTVALCGRRKDGTEFPLELSLAMWETAQGPFYSSVLRDITERKHAEQKIAAMLRFQNEMLDTPASWIDTLDAGGNITFWNRGAERISGYLREEVMGHSRVWGWLYPDAEERDRAFAKAMAIIQQGEWVEDFETVIRRKDGERRTISWYSNNLVDETGQIVGSIAVGADITERKQAEAALRESEARYRRLTDNARDIVFRFSIVPEIRLTYINPAVQAITGYTPEECYADPMLNMAHPDDAPMMAGFVGALTPPDEALSMRWIGKDGAVRWMESRMVPVYDPTGQIVAVEGITRDMTERKRAEDELHRAHEMLRTVLDTTPQRVAWRDRDAVYLGANKAFAHDAGLAEPAAIIGKRDADLIWRAYSDSFEAEDREIIATNTPMPPTDSLLILPDGTRFWQRIRKAPLHDATGAVIGVLNTYEDITEEKQADQKLHQTLEELARSNEELERFAYVASHDLQEPLRMVASFVQLLAERYRGQLDSDADEFIGFAVEGAQRMQQLINDLLAYSRIGTRGEPLQPTDAEAVLNDALWNLSFAIEDAGAVVTHDPLPAVLADPTQLLQLLQNLIGNALKFRSEAPPVVHISAQLQIADRRLQIDEAIPKSEISNLKSEWLFSVRDNGIGIAPEYYDRIFGVFQRLHSRSEYPGTGIGLAICRRVVERHGGRVWVESQVGQGTTFCFTLPAVPETA